MEEAIKKAIEGGYEPFITVKMSELICEIVGNNMVCNFKSLADGSLVKGICSANVSRIQLDKRFWECLGKSLGWKQVYSSEFPYVQYVYEWHKFIDHLAEGKDAESFFKELITKE